MEIIDLRSDTVTLPTKEMREAMANAKVGDDVYEDDPTLKELEALAAQKTGKEAGLFVPSGVFGNMLAVMTHTKAGDEILLMENSHIMINEGGGAARISGVQTRMIPMSSVNTIDPIEIEKRIRGKNIHYPDTGLICLENALGNGTIMPLENMKEIRKISLQHNVPIHLDGARVFNAALGLGIDVKEICNEVDSLMFCISKALGSPVGSLLVGTKEFIKKARRNRKILGGGMRQAGVLAAPGIISLTKMVDRLDEDHENARWLASELDKIPTIKVDKELNQINMVFFTLENSKISGKDLAHELAKENIIINSPEGNESIRFIPNYNTDRKKLEKVIKTMRKILE